MLGKKLTGIEFSPAYATKRTVLLSTHGWLSSSRDAGQSWQRLAGYARVDDRLQTVQPSSGWDLSAAPANPSDALSTTSLAGAWQEFQFEGDSIACCANVGPSWGKVLVALDGVPVAQVRLAAPESAVEVRVWNRSFQHVGWHTLRVANAGATPQDPNTSINSDGFEITD
jgi:hypothetical protein